MPHIVEFRVMVTRVLSTIATVVAGLAGGKVRRLLNFLYLNLSSQLLVNFNVLLTLLGKDQSV